MKDKRSPNRGHSAREVDDDDLDGEGYERPHRRIPRRRPLRKLALFLLISAAIVAAFPTIIAKTPLRNTLLAYALPQNALRVTVADASLGWLSPPTFSGIEVRDSAGQPLATVASIRTTRTPLALATNWRELGEIEIQQPVVYLAVRPDGTNWEDVAAALAKTQAETAPGKAAATIKIPVAVTARVVDGTLLVEETASGRRWRMHELNVQLDAHGAKQGLPQISVAGKIESAAAAGANAIATNPSAPAGSFALALSTDGGRQKLSWQLQGIPLAAAEAWLQRIAPGAEIRGGLFGQGTASWSTAAATTNPFTDWTTSGMLTLQSVDATAPALGGDRVRLASVELPWRITAQPSGVTVEDLQLRSDVGQVAVRGRLDPAAFSQSMNGDPTALNASGRHDVELSGEIDLARLAAMLPRLLRIRDDTTITSGSLQLAGRSQPIDGGQSLSGMLRTTGLAATSAGRPIVWDQPVDAAFEIRRENGAVRLESLKCDSEFLRVTAAGTPKQLTANAEFDLNRLAAQLGQFVELTGAELAGTGTAHVDWQLLDGDQFAAAANAELAQLRVALGDGKMWTEPRLAIQAEAAGTLDTSTRRPLQVATARIQVDAEGDQLDAQLTEPVNCTADAPTWPAKLRMTGQVARWLTRVRPWFAPDGWQIDGQSELAAEVRAAANAVDVANAQLTVSNLSVAGKGWSIAEPRVELAGDLHWNGATGEVAAQSAQLVSSAVSLAAKDVRLQRTGAGPPRVQGVAAFRTDLARLAAWRAAPKQASLYQPQGMVTGNVRFAQQADRVTGEFSATGQNLALLQRAQSADKTIWQEPQINVRGTTIYESDADRLAFRQVQIQSTTLAMMADGEIDKLSTTADVNASGSLNYDLAQVTPLLKPFVGEGIQLVGRETAQFEAKGSLANSISGVHWSRTLVARGELPWASANVYGLQVGPGKLAAALGDGSVRVDPLSIAVAEGRLDAAPQVRLDPGPMELTLPPGPVLTNVRISPEVSEAMLKYIAPVLSGATQSEGQFSLQLGAARVPLAEPRKADVAGQLAVHSVRVVPGPMARQWVDLAQQIESIAKRRDLASLGQRQSATLLAISDQQVNFRVVDGRVYHQGMQFQVGDVALRSEGSVGLDETLALVLHVPIQDRWIEGQALLVGLKGQSISIPISGTLRQPRMDQSAVAGLSQQLLQGAAQQAIGGELNKALDKFFKPR